MSYGVSAVLKINFRLALCLAAVLMFPVQVLAQEGLRVVASLAPVHSILSGLMEGVRQPDLLLGKGRLPYGATLSESEKGILANADLLVWVGPELEPYLIEEAKRLQEAGKVQTLLDSDTLKVLPSRWNETDRDPFIWLDTRNALILLDDMAELLMNKDPAHAHLYRANRDRMNLELSDFDRRLENGYRGMKGGLGIEYFDTLQYFEQAYALKIAGVVTRAPGTTPDAERLLTERMRLAEGAYACLFTEKGMDMPELPLLTAGALVNRVELDSFGTGFEPGAGLYMAMMEHNTNLIRSCFEQRANDIAGQQVEEADAPTIGGHFILTDHNGNLVRDTDMLGKYQMIYFGYTFCPDVCPTSLQVMSAALNELGSKADLLQAYFITVDPERDTVPVMAAYVNYFNKRLIGLSGSRAMTDRLMKQYKVVAEKVVEEGTDPSQYVLDHTASIYLMAPDGRFITKFAHGISAQQMVDKINEYVHD